MHTRTHARCIYDACRMHTWTSLAHMHTQTLRLRALFHALLLYCSFTCSPHSKIQQQAGTHQIVGDHVQQSACLVLRLCMFPQLSPEKKSISKQTGGKFACMYVYNATHIYMALLTRMHACMYVFMYVCTLFSAFLFYLTLMYMYTHADT